MGVACDLLLDLVVIIPCGHARLLPMHRMGCDRGLEACWLSHGCGRAMGQSPRCIYLGRAIRLWPFP